LGTQASGAEAQTASQALNVAAKAATPKSRIVFAGCEATQAGAAMPACCRRAAPLQEKRAL